MKVTKCLILKVTLHVVCTIMFLVQMRVAVLNLVYVPTVMTTGMINFSDIRPPLILLCPQIQFTKSNIKLSHFLTGSDKPDSPTDGQLSWIGGDNETFTGLALEIFDQHNLKIIEELNPTIELVQTFLPANGFCLEVFQTTQMLSINLNASIISDVLVTITDRSGTTVLSQDLASQTGDKIFFRKNTSFIETIRIVSYKKIIILIL